jgi:hypothetical protein
LTGRPRRNLSPLVACPAVPSRPVLCERRVAGALAALGDFRLQHSAKAGGARMVRWKSLLGPRYPLCVALTHSGCTRSRYHVAEEQSKRQSTIVSEACIPPVTRYAARHTLSQLPVLAHGLVLAASPPDGVWSLGCNAVHVWKRLGPRLQCTAAMVIRAQGYTVKSAPCRVLLFDELYS